MSPRTSEAHEALVRIASDKQGTLKNSRRPAPHRRLNESLASSWCQPHGVHLTSGQVALDSGRVTAGA